MIIKWLNTPLLISGIYVGNVIAHLANDENYKNSKSSNDNLIPFP
jgi:hypothetical protein